MMLYNYRGKIVRVSDGDTVVIDIDTGFQMWLRGERCRLSGIDAPETWGKVEPGGEEAKRWLTERLEAIGNEVRIHTEKSPDKYGRWLVTLYDPADMKNINLEMVELGLATRYVG